MDGFEWFPLLPGESFGFQVFVKGGHPVNDPIGGYLDDSVGNGLDELMVMGGKEDIALKVDEPVVEGGDRFQIQVVGGLVQKKDVGARQHHLGEHAAHLLAAGEDLDRFECLVPREEHPAQKAPQSVENWASHSMMERSHPSKKAELS